MNPKSSSPGMVLAVDLGASSGRLLSCVFDGETIRIEELHRFDNQPVQLLDTLYWDFPRLFHEIKRGLAIAFCHSRESGLPILSMGIDTWGVDFGLLDRQGRLIGLPVHYRDRRTEGIMDRVFSRIPKKEIFERTGIQFLPFNTIFQLAAMKEAGDPNLERAESLLMMPDLLYYFLTGEKIAEFTIATTSQLYDPRKGNWSDELIATLGLPRGLFQPIVQPGTKKAPLLKSIADELGGQPVPVLAVATHDTASAVAAVPSGEGLSAYLSCGTWSLLGTETSTPRIDDRALRLNFTNEGGVEKTYRLLKNIMGLWILQEIKREWESRGQRRSWEEIAALASMGDPLVSFIDPDDARFLAPGAMPPRIQDYCRKTGQIVPESEQDLLRVVLDSLAMKYSWVLDRLDELTGRKSETLHMVGGGIRNELLCQLTANAIARPVLAGPIEATALGNIAVQFIGLGAFRSIAEARTAIGNSFPIREYHPLSVTAWEEGYERFCQILKR